MVRVRLPAPRCLVALAALALAACGLGDGERFGRPSRDPLVLRLHVLEEARELDPARARTPLERSIARQLFAALVEDTGGKASPSLASSWREEGGAVLFTLRDDARFSNGDPLRAPDVVWSWQRALRPSTGTADPRPLAVIRGGAELSRGALLRVLVDTEGRPAPYPVFRDGPGDDVGGVRFGAGAPVRVVDTNLRAPCCRDPVTLLEDARADAAPAGLVRPGEVAVVVGRRETLQGKAATSWLRLRASSGAAGWVREVDVVTHVPFIGLAHVVDRGGSPPSLRAGPDADAPVRATLADDDVVEVIERTPDGAFVVDTATGRAGFVDARSFDDTVRERRWLLVAPVDGGPAGWLSDQDLAFDPGLLGARAVDERTIEVSPRAGASLDELLEALADPVLRPVPSRLVAEHGRGWIAPGLVATSGPWILADVAPRARMVLARSSTSFERDRARLDRVELVVIDNKTSALHLYRAGLLDVIFDGALPPGLASTLSRASDFVPGPAGGGLVAPEVKGLDGSVLELRDVSRDDEGTP